jgi:beta-N-acetylhexosaminidase
MREFLTRWRLAGGVALGIALIAIVAVVATNSGGGAGSGSEEEPAGSTTTSAAPEGPAGSLSEDELVDTVILAGFNGTDPGADIVKEVSDHRLGGVLIAADNWDGKEKGRKLIEAIRTAGSKDGADPPLIAVAQEGGPYRVLDDLPPEQREIEIGDRGDPDLAEAWGEDMAHALRDVGIDLELGPVADVATLDSPIADRAFSDDTGVAAEMTAAAIDGCEKAGVACAPTHFPGLGAAAQDTDEGPTSVGLDEATLESRDLPPFIAAFRAGAPATVVSHAFYAMDPVTPGTLSRPVSTDLLRNRAHFDGVAISDDIGAGAITAVGPPEDAAVKALAAGIDLVQVADPDSVEPVRRAIRAALEDGTLSEDRLRQAAGRVLALRRSLAAEAEPKKDEKATKDKASGAKRDQGSR